MPRRSRRMTRAGLHVEFRVDLEQKQTEMDNRNTCMKALAHSYESLVKVAIELVSVKGQVARFVRGSESNVLSHV